MYLHIAAVLTNPSMAISSAASKYKVVFDEMPNKMISAMLFIYIVSRARMRSGLLGPLKSRHKFSINEIQMKMLAIITAVLNIRKSP